MGSEFLEKEIDGEMVELRVSLKFSETRVQLKLESTLKSPLSIGVDLSWRPENGPFYLKK